MSHGGEFDAIFTSEALIAAGNVEEVFVGVSSDEDTGNFLFEIALNELHHDTHSQRLILSATNNINNRITTTPIPIIMGFNPLTSFNI